MSTAAVLVVSIFAVVAAAFCVDKMLDVVKVAEQRGPTIAAAGFTVQLGIVAGVIAGLIWAWSASF